MPRDYLNLTDGAFDQFSNKLNQYLAQKCSATSPEWTHISVTALQELQDVYVVWHTAYEKTIGPHTPIDTEAKNEAKAKIRPFVNVYLRKDQSAVTDKDRFAIAIPNKDTTPTTHPVPNIKPVTEAVPSGKGKHTVTALNPESGDKKRPNMVKGIAFACRVRNINDPKNSANDVPSVFQVETVREYQWTEADYGKVCDYTTVYENEGSKRGAWSDVISVIIAYSILS